MKTLKMVSRRNVLMSIYVIFMLASVTLFPSCYATMQSPRSPRAEVVVITGHDRGEHQNGDDRNERRRLRQERRHNHDDN